jgi:hypothetical protein
MVVGFLIKVVAGLVPASQEVREAAFEQVWCGLNWIGKEGRECTLMEWVSWVVAT